MRTGGSVLSTHGSTGAGVARGLQTDWQARVVLTDKNNAQTSHGVASLSGYNRREEITMNCKRKIMDWRAGFTLIELILVVAVVAILAAILVPTVFSILDDSAITKGKADVKAIAGALVKFRDDTGVFPTRDADVANGEVNLLYSGTVAPLIPVFSPSPGAAFDCTTAANCDTFQFPFITNA